MAEPDCVIELAAITVMNCGTDGGCADVFPVPLVQFPSQFAGLGFVAFANPLKLEGAKPPDSEFSLAH